jgi:anti-sigma regulatory factor (Ser/Thr protein kinase)
MHDRRAYAYRLLECAVTMRQAPRAAAGDGTGAWHDAAASLPGTGDSRAPIASSYHGHDLERWPLRDTLILGALPDAVPSARAHLRQLLRQWGHAELDGDAAVVISELVTNAVAASAELRPAVAPVLMWLGSDRRHVLAAVADTNLQPPMRLSLGPDAERGRGLALVEALSSRWGWHPASTGGLRKFIWAEWHLPSGSANVQLSDCRVRLNHRCLPRRHHAGITMRI